MLVLLVGAILDAVRGGLPQRPMLTEDDLRTPVVSADTTRVDLNTASASALERLPGIGPVLARRIVEFRRRRGPFRHPDELRAVRGIGPRMMERIRDRVRVGP